MRMPPVPFDRGAAPPAMMYFSRLKTAVILGVCLLGVLLCMPNLFPAPAAWLPWRPGPSRPRPARRQLPAAGGRHGGGHQGAARQPRRRGAPGAAQRRASSTRRSRAAAGQNRVAAAAARPGQTSDAAIAALQPLTSRQWPTARRTSTIARRRRRRDHPDALAGGAARPRHRAPCSNRSRSSAAASTRPACSIRRSRARATDRIVVQLPGIEDPNRIKQLLGKTAHMTFRLVDETANPIAAAAAAGRRLPADAGPARPEDRRCASRVEVDGADLTDARAGPEPADRRVGGELHLRQRRRAALRRRHPRQCRPSASPSCWTTR